MNKKRVLQVADAIEKGEVANLGFNMSGYFFIQDAAKFADQSGRNCGTLACIAGWTLFTKNRHTVDEFENDAVWDEKYPDVKDTARVWLDLTNHQATNLFFWHNRRMSWNDIPASAAVAVLRHLAETGEVNWDIAL